MGIRVTMYRRDDVAFIAHPKTGSMAVRTAFMANGWESSLTHHEIIFPLPPRVVSVIREPEDWYVSWFFQTKWPLPFAEWLPWFITNDRYSRKGFNGLPHSTHVIFYDRLQQGLNEVFDEFGFGRIELPIVNRKKRNGRPPSEFFTDDLRKLIDPNMVLTYNRLLQKRNEQGFIHS